MHYDDRLVTVLRLRTDGASSARVQFRQLVDLLGTLPGEAQDVQIAAAYDRLIALGGAIPAAERAAIIAEQGLRLRSPRLISFLAASESAVAAAAMRKAELADEEWLDLVPALPVAARGFVRLRRNLPGRVVAMLERLGIHDRGLPPADVTVELAVDRRESVGDGPGVEGKVQEIGDIVRRIEEYRRTHPVGPERMAAIDAPRLPLDEGAADAGDAVLRRFDFTTDVGGRIDWAEAACAAMVIGLKLASNAALTERMRRHQPLVGAAIELDGAPALGGAWRVDAEPVFAASGGSFAGYRGRMRRPLVLVSDVDPSVDSEADRIRQLLHELRTPVNAIQGFAEVIHQQLFGPAPHEYRALAATIAGDAARILAGFEELDRLARLTSGALELEEGRCDFCDVVRATAEQLAVHTKPRQSGFALKLEAGELPVALARIEAERVTWRLLAALAAATAPGEVLRLKLRSRGAILRLTLNLPSVLAKLDDDQLFHATAGTGPSALSAGTFGTGFSLRLVSAEAKAAGGGLERRADRLRLTLPLATHSDVNHGANITA